MIQEVTTKQCSKCQEIKSISEFYKRKISLDGYAYICKNCNNEYIKKYYIKNKLTYSQKFKNKYINDEKFKDRCKETSKVYRKENIEYYKDYNENYRQYHKEHFRIYSKNYRYKNRDNINYKLLENIRKRQGNLLKNNQKTGHSIDLLMCTVEEWRKHLESQFTEGMSWENYGNKEGQWSIDHIIPCDFFKDHLADPTEQYMCFRWQNTRPMWHIDNIKKSNKIKLEK